MADRPILFSGPMVRALLAGTKTQTRRTLKFQPAPGISIIRKTIRPLDGSPYHSFERRSVYGNYAGELDIRIKRGDRLWVRESWKPHSTFDHLPPREMPESNVFYLADEKYSPSGSRGRPGIHMPRWASRLTLTVTDVRVERLQDITEEDARAEGCSVTWSGDMSEGPSKWANENYADLWDDINGPGAWEANPWVVAYTFTVDKRNIDQIARVA
ncbi:hypothetical protein HJB78_27175 [Rhizobium lentis]|uniref:hypothetical protein n=1 Tax=Rhizobium lentis TaxID=1138194 RepID=UPI001C830A1E|nr:hypothetical protein [Rhizobium lentis]MBX5154598.1 hypothetical protein [Rhizobium lentis]